MEVWMSLGEGLLGRRGDAPVVGERERRSAGLWFCLRWAVGSSRDYVGSGCGLEMSKWWSRAVMRKLVMARC
jgi:hypothetical protein